MENNKILIVDDEEAILILFTEAFEGEGYEVFAAGDAEEALAIITQENIQIFFLDLNLPGMNGIELCRQIRKEHPMAIIHAVTGYASLFQLRDCRVAGFDDYFAKPVNLADLFAAADDAFAKLARWLGKG